MCTDHVNRSFEIFSEKWTSLHVYRPTVVCIEVIPYVVRAQGCRQPNQLRWWRGRKMRSERGNPSQKSEPSNKFSNFYFKIVRFSHCGVVFADFNECKPASHYNQLCILVTFWTANKKWHQYNSEHPFSSFAAWHTWQPMAVIVISIFSQWEPSQRKQLENRQYLLYNIYINFFLLERLARAKPGAPLISGARPLELLI